VLLLAIATFIIQYDLAPIELVCSLAFVGAIAGDHLGFHIGRMTGPGFHKTKIAAKYSTSIAKGENLIQKFGSAAIFIGRFVPAVRSFVPALMGLSGFQRIRYSLFDALACLLWSTALGLIVLGIETVL
jgi:membrane-associated protein